MIRIAVLAMNILAVASVVVVILLSYKTMTKMVVRTWERILEKDWKL